MEPPPASGAWWVFGVPRPIWGREIYLKAKGKGKEK
jgi:hypothetical protein